MGIRACDGAENAEKYAEFTQQFPMYAETSSDLVARADVGVTDSVVDLCAGTGATTQQILRQLPDESRLEALDGSPAMLHVAKSQITDQRVRWIPSPAETFDSHLLTPTSAVICNSAIWQTDMSSTFAAARRALRPGGRLIFNIGEQFVQIPGPDDRAQPESPTLIELMHQIASADFGFEPQRSTRTRMSAPEVEHMLSEAGLHATDVETLTYERTVQQTRAWLALPVFAGSFRSLPAEQRFAVLDKAYAQVDHDQVMVSRWLVVTAVRRGTQGA